MTNWSLKSSPPHGMMGIMILFGDQPKLGTDHGFHSSSPTKKLGVSCKPGEAQFQSCLVSLTSIIPAVIAILILLMRVLQPLLRHCPTWMKPFINELNEKGQELKIEDKRCYAPPTTALLVIIPIGLAVQIMTLLYPSYDIRGVLPALAWVK